MLAQLLLQAPKKPSRCGQLNLLHPNRLRSKARNWLEGLPGSTKRFKKKKKKKNYFLPLYLLQSASNRTITPLRAPNSAQAARSGSLGGVGREKAGIAPSHRQPGDTEPGAALLPTEVPPPPRLGR